MNFNLFCFKVISYKRKKKSEVWKKATKSQGKIYHQLYFKFSRERMFWDKLEMFLSIYRSLKMEYRWIYNFQLRLVVTMGRDKGFSQNRIKTGYHFNEFFKFYKVFSLSIFYQFKVVYKLVYLRSQLDLPILLETSFLSKMF